MNYRSDTDALGQMIARLQSQEDDIERRVRNLERIQVPGNFPANRLLYSQANGQVGYSSQITVASDAGANSLELGANPTGNKLAYIDLIGDTTYTDFGSRWMRDNTGPNALTVMYHRGTGAFRVEMVDAGADFEIYNGSRIFHVETTTPGGAINYWLGDSDTGFTWVSDGLVRGRANNANVFSWNGTYFEHHTSTMIAPFGSTGVSTFKLYVVGDTATALNYAAVFRNSALTNLMHLENSGVAWVNQAWTVGSSQEYKKNIRAIAPETRKKLRQLKGKMRQYEYTAGDTKPQMGYIFEDIAADFPELATVSQMPHTEVLSWNEDGTPNETRETTKEVKGLVYGNLVPWLIEYLLDFEDEVRAALKAKK